VAVDALVWEGAGRDVLAVLEGHPDASQHLLRAAIFRVVVDHLCNLERSTAPPWWPSLMRAVDEVCHLAESAERGG
jgi:hypothetical protein